MEWLAPQEKRALRSPEAARLEALGRGHRVLQLCLERERVGFRTAKTDCEALFAAFRMRHASAERRICHF